MRRLAALFTLVFTLLLGCDSPSNPVSNPPAPQVAVPPPPPPPPGSSPATAPPTGATSEALTLTKSEQRAGFSLKTYVGKQPVLLIFNQAEDEWFRKFSEGLSAAQEDVSRHNLVVIEVLNTMMAYPNARIRGGQALSEEAASNLFDSFGPGGGSFMVVLIGKDGKVIERHKGFIEASELLAKLPSE